MADDAMLISYLVRYCGTKPEVLPALRDRLAEGREIQAGGQVFRCAIIRIAIEQVEAAGGVVPTMHSSSASSSSSAAVALPDLREVSVYEGLEGVVGNDAAAMDVEVEPAMLDSAPLADEAPAPSAASSEPEGFVLQSYHGLLELHLNGESGQCELIHTETGERSPLPDTETEWLLDVSDDGEAMLIELSEQGDPKTYRCLRSVASPDLHSL